jgi:hypothetical protein
MAAAAADTTMVATVAMDMAAMDEDMDEGMVGEAMDMDGDTHTIMVIRIMTQL